MSTELSEVLGKFMAREDRSVGRLAALSDVPKKTITNWLSGDVRKPHQWQPLLRVASVLHLNQEETEELICSATYPPLIQLYSTCTPAEHLLFSPWRETLTGNTSLKKRPFQVQDDLASFVGRQEEIEQLKSIILQERRAAICGLRGMGGVGKSTLATHLAYLLKEEFPDGVLWARLDVSDTLTILQSFAQAFDMDVNHFRDVESRAASVRSLLADKSLLVILDNAENSHQVRPLLPPNTENCAVLVTTRNDLSAIDGWNQVVVGPFKKEEGEALQLFEKQLGSEFVQRHHDHLTEIADLVGHLPLAISIIGGHLKATRWIKESPEHTEFNTLLELFHQIKDEASRLKILDRDDQNIQLSFNLSYYSLPEELQDFFPQLGVFGGEDFSLEAIAWVTENDLEYTQHCVNAIIGRSLLEPGRSGRFRLHPLLRNYALACLASLDDSGESHTFSRMLTYFANLSELHQSDYEVLNNEMSNLIFAHKVGVEKGLLQSSVKLAITLFPRLEMLGLYQIAEEQMRVTLELAKQYNDNHAIALALLQLGIILMRRGEYLSSIDIYGQALEAARQVNDPLLCARIEKYMASSYLSIPDNVNGEMHANEAWRIAQIVDDDEFQAEVHIIMGTIAEDHSDMVSAEFHQSQAALYAKKASKPRWLTVALLNLSELLERRGAFEEAESVAYEGLTIAQNMNYLERISGLSAMLGRIYRQLNQFARSEEYLTKGLEIARQLNHPWLISHNLIEFGWLHLAQNHLSKAFTSFAQAQQTSMAVNILGYAGQSLWGMAVVEQQRDNIGHALELANKSLVILDSINHFYTPNIRQLIAELDQHT